MLIEINGKRWKLTEMTSNALGRDKFGECDPPSKQGKEIRIYYRLKGEKRLEILLHEMLHASDWSKDETWVDGTARDLARALTRLGYVNIKEVTDDRKKIIAGG